MEKFIKMNELKIPIEYYIIGTLNQNAIKYVIYTDFLFNKTDDLKLYCGRYNNDIIVDIDIEEANRIIKEFKVEEEKVLKIMEEKNEV